MEGAADAISTIVEIKERGLTDRKLNPLYRSTIVEIKERGLTQYLCFHLGGVSTIVEIKERGLTLLKFISIFPIYNSRN